MPGGLVAGVQQTGDLTPCPAPVRGQMVAPVGVKEDRGGAVVDHT